MFCCPFLQVETVGDKKAATPAEPAKQKVKVIDLPIIPHVPRMTKEQINLLMEKEVRPPGFYICLHYVLYLLICRSSQSLYL